jgi:hypothetical protein
MASVFAAVAVLLGCPLAGLSIDRPLVALEGFERWQPIRAVPQTLTFGANVWALVALFGG